MYNYINLYTFAFSGKLIHPSKLPEVEQLLYYLQNRKNVSANTTNQAAKVSSDSDAEPGSSGSTRVQSANSASLHRYSPVDDPSKIEDPEGKYWLYAKIISTYFIRPFWNIFTL